MATETALRTTLHPQLAEIQQELLDATARLRRLLLACSDDSWARKPSASAWSAAECIIHLNLTSEKALPVLRRAIENARPQKRVSTEPYRLDVIGRLLLRFTEPPYRVRAPSSAAFVASAIESQDAVLAKFEDLQHALIEIVEAADGLPLNEIKIAGPFTSA